MTDKTIRGSHGIEWTPYSGETSEDNRTISIDPEARANVSLLASRLTGAFEEIEELRKEVADLESAGRMSPEKSGLRIKLYCVQHGYTSAPAEGSHIGAKGGVGANYPSLSLNEGEYPILDIYEIETVDFGTVRWVQIRCGENDPTRTNDWFAYIPVRPDLVDTENLYNQLFDADGMTMLDSITMKAWGHDGFRSFMTKRALSKDVPNGTSYPERKDAPRFA